MSDRPSDTPPRDPIFLLSLPRSGSTYVQRVLSSHKDIATTSEPWLLLPLLYATKPFGTAAEYGHGTAFIGIQDFMTELANGPSDYRAAVRRFALDLYSKATAKHARYFLDKTPRYHFVAEELFELFPEGKFIFLWRNPIDIVASILASWSGGRWNLHRYQLDLRDGLASLVRARDRYRARSVAVRYEDLLQRGDATWAEVFDYLGLDFDPELLGRSDTVALKGRLGDTGKPNLDPDGRSPSNEGKRMVLGNPFRKSWCRRYLTWIGQERLSGIGYDLETLLSELDDIPPSLRFLPSDSIRFVRGTIRQRRRWRLLGGRRLSSMNEGGGTMPPWDQRSDRH